MNSFTHTTFSFWYRWLFNLLIFGISLFIFQEAVSQCIDTTCYVDKLLINTGYDYTTNAPLGTTSGLNTVQDPFWLLVNAPTSNGPINLGSPAFVINKNSAWDEMQPLSPNPPSRYISAFPNAGSNQANIVGTPYTFQHKICICKDSTEIIFSDSIHVDNRVQLKILGPGLPIGGTILSEYNSTVVGNFRNPPNDDGPTTLTLDQGTYFLQAETRNDNAGSPMGLNIAGLLTANKKSISKESCCNNGAFVSGYKYLDNNCNSLIDNGDPVSQGWTIELVDSLTNLPIVSTTTDVNGYYFFNITSPGNYIIREVVSIGGFVQTFPAGNIHNVTITGTEIISNLNFANCCQDCFNFLQSAPSVALNCSTQDNFLEISALSGILPTDTISLDINCDGIYEVQDVSGDSSLSYFLPHYGSFDLKIKVSRILCDYPCDLIIEKAIVAEEEDCGEPTCYEHNYLDFACIASCVTSYDSLLIIGGYEGLPDILSFDGTTKQTIATSPVQGDIIEVEPYKGDLYAMGYNGSHISVYKHNSVFWALERSIVAPSFSTAAGFLPFSWTLPEMQHLDGYLYVAFLKNAPRGTVSHSIHRYDGTNWTILPDPRSSLAGYNLNRYFQIGQYKGSPMIVLEEYNRFTNSVVNYLATWGGASWRKITPAFQIKKSTPAYFFDGIFNVDYNDDVIVVVGNFDEINNVSNTKFVAQFDISSRLWRDVGRGATSSPTSSQPSLNDVVVIGDDIFVGGDGVEALGSSSTSNFGWYNGSSWDGLAFPGFIISDFHKNKQDDGGCSLIYVGECGIGEIMPCCLYEDLYLTNVEMGPVYYKTHGQITTESTITSTGDVFYSGGQGVIPQPPFNVQAGGRVVSYSEGCKDCCPIDPLNDLPFLAPYIGNAAYSITKCMYNGDCIYKITDFCQLSDGETAYYDCLGNKICSDFGFTSTCPLGFAVTACQVLQSC